MEKLTRADAIAAAGQNAVDTVDSLNCVPSGRCMQPHEDHLVEWAANLALNDDDDKILTVYYLTTTTDDVITHVIKIFSKTGMVNMRKDFSRAF